MEDGTYIVSKKNQFVPVEMYFLDYWSPILQKEEKGTAYIYVCMQRFINNQASSLNGKVWVSNAKLSKISGYGREKIINCRKVLEAYGLIIKVRDGRKDGVTNTYVIPELPSVPDSLKDEKVDVFSVGVSEEVTEASNKAKELLLKKVDTELQKFIKDNDDITKWSSTKFYRYYYLLYHSTFGISCGRKSPNRELLGKIRNMLDTYNASGTKKIIDKAIRYWNQLISPSTSPTFENIYNKRQDLYNLGDIVDNNTEGYYNESDI